LLKRKGNEIELEVEMGFDDGFEIAVISLAVSVVI
jgi:hypothetical protein